MRGRPRALGRVAGLPRAPWREMPPRLERSASTDRRDDVEDRVDGVG